MPEIVITDTSILILFQKINKLELLKEVYDSLVTTPEILQEFGQDLPDWISIQNAKDKKYQEFLETQVDEGEASILALAKENEKPLVLLDDLKARKLAKQLNIKFTGALGVVHKAKQLQIINQIKPLIDAIVRTNFRISEEIVSELLKLNDEL